jgi:1-acyl-sn-glycerol-3-phosphate acyltransferase
MAVFGVIAGVALLTMRLCAIPLASFFPGVYGRSALWIGGVRLAVTGEEHLRAPGSRILVLNHQSALEVPVVCALGPVAPLVLGKRELIWFPVFNVMWWSLGQIFVDRKDPAAASKSLDAVVAELRKHPRTVIVAPEGTRSRDGKLGRFKLGAFRIAAASGAPIVPVVLHGTGKLMPPGRWWSEPGVIRVEIKPPIPTGGWTGDLRPHADALEDDYRRWLSEIPSQAS